MAEEFNLPDDDYSAQFYHRVDGESGNLPSKRRMLGPRNEVRERLSSVRDYLAAPGPDPQWEKLKVVLSILLDIFWIVASMLIFHLTDFYIRVLYDRRMDREWLMYSSIAVGVDVLIGGYYIVYLTCIRRVNPEGWDLHWRWGFPIATLAFFVAVITFTVAAWNIWWIFTPAILFLFFMGFITVVSYIPDFGGGGSVSTDDLKNSNSSSSSRFDHHKSDTKTI